MLANRVRWPRPRSRHPLLALARWLWTLPTNIVGHAAGLLASGRLPSRVGGAAAVGWLYPIRRGRGLDWVGAVTLGHAILHRPGLLDGRALVQRLTLAHELAHTRQHDRLGPLYLPLHISAQAISALLSLGGRPIVSRVHDRNPLEQTFICISAGATHLDDLPSLRDAREIEDFLAAFGA